MYLIITINIIREASYNHTLTHDINARIKCNILTVYVAINFSFHLHILCDILFTQLISIYLIQFKVRNQKAHFCVNVFIEKVERYYMIISFDCMSSLPFGSSKSRSSIRFFLQFPSVCTVSILYHYYSTY
jgi:hypothetical protein